jgi:tetratricopeptide (TPR) repeat protein
MVKRRGISLPAKLGHALGIALFGAAVCFIADYSKAIELKPDWAAAYYYNRGIAENAKGDLDGAIADYSKAIALKPDDADAYSNRGVAKRAKGDLDGANADYSKASELLGSRHPPVSKSTPRATKLPHR